MRYSGSTVGVAVGTALVGEIELVTDEALGDLDHVSTV